jgi:hypothetical protein
MHTFNLIVNWWLSLSLEQKIISLIFLPLLPLGLLRGWLFPHLLAPTVRGFNLEKPAYHFVSLAALPTSGAGGTLMLQVPFFARISEPVLVSVRCLGEVPNGVCSSLSPKVEVANFKITGGQAEDENDAERLWAWVVVAQEPGESSLLVKFGPALSLRATDPLYFLRMRPQGPTLQARVVVCTGGMKRWRRVKRFYWDECDR